MLKRGMQGEAVRAWQRIVGVSADGIFGVVTEQATRQWQAERGLEPDGVVPTALLEAAGVLPPAPMVCLIDVSQVQGRVDWAKVRGAGVAGVIVKVTEGSYLDPRRLEYLTGARGEGLFTGVYHFARLGQSSAEVQLRNLWNAMGDTFPSLGLVLDCESAPASMSPQAIVDWIARWADEAERYTVLGSGLYSYLAFLQQLRTALVSSDAGKRVATMRLWLAHYLWRGEGPPPPHVRPTLPAPWTRLEIWQCNGGGAAHLDGPPIPGISVPCDRNFWFGTEAELAARWGGIPNYGVETGWKPEPIVRPDVTLGRPALDGEKVPE